MSDVLNWNILIHEVWNDIFWGDILSHMWHCRFRTHKYFCSWASIQYYILEPKLIWLLLWHLHMESSLKIVRVLVCSVILIYGRANYSILFRFPYVTVVFLKQQFCCRGEWGLCRVTLCICERSRWVVASLKCQVNLRNRISVVAHRIIISVRSVGWN